MTGNYWLGVNVGQEVILYIALSRVLKDGPHKTSSRTIAASLSWGQRETVN